jgi:F-type H+-transporting ATPase subunit a
MNISIAAETLFHIGSFPVTNALLNAVTVSVLLMLGAWILARKMKKANLVPQGFQNAVELVVEGVWGIVDGVAQDKKLSRKFFPLVATIFIFILLSNWSGLLPGTGTVGIWEEHHGETVLVPFIRSGSADLNIALAISLVTVFAVQFVGIAAIGAFKYARKFLVSPFHKPYIVGTAVGLLELISEAMRTVSFSFRLFGNVFAGEVLLIVILNLVPYALPLPFLFLEFFVGLIQAAVFAMLALVFLKMATLEGEH